jgi:membrane protein DedA with SNARE-associated domain
VTILTLIGYTVGANQELVEQWSRTATFWLLLASILIVALYWKWRRS